MNTQQTPKPEAQLPSIEPPLLVHSDEEKQVPRTDDEEVEDLPEHWL